MKSSALVHDLEASGAVRAGGCSRTDETDIRQASPQLIPRTSSTPDRTDPAHRKAYSSPGRTLVIITVPTLGTWMKDPAASSLFRELLAGTVA